MTPMTPPPRAAAPRLPSVRLPSERGIPTTGTVPSWRLRVKVCGVTTEPILDAVCRSGADFVGFVSHPPSRRHIDPHATGNLLSRAAQQGRSLPKVVSVCVDPTDRLCASIAEHIRPDVLQLHGSETPERVEELRRRFPWSVIKSVGLPAQSPGADPRPDPCVQTRIKEFQDAGAWVMIDALVGGVSGGLGVRVSTAALTRYRGLLHDPWFLAGGLEAQNVAEAAAAVRPWAVDASSGLEDPSGCKTVDAVMTFVAAARGIPEQPNPGS